MRAQRGADIKTCKQYSMGGLQQESVSTEPVVVAMAVPLPEELMSSVLVFLRMKDLLEWRVVSSSTKAM